MIIGYKYFILFCEIKLNITDKIKVVNIINITVPIGSYKYQANYLIHFHYTSQIYYLQYYKYTLSPFDSA